MFSLWDPWRCWGWVRRNRNKSPPANKKNIQDSGGCPFLNKPEKYNFGDASTQQAMGPCATLQNHQNLCWKNLIFLSLLWDELYGWNSRNWKKWGKISQILNAVTLSRPKRVFFSGKLFTLSCFCSVISHNHFLPDIVCWLASCYNIFSSFSDLLCMVILFFFATGDELLGRIPQKIVKIEKIWDFVTFP